MASIEEEIKQKKFLNPYQKLLVNILFTGSWLYSRHAKLLKPYGLTVEQYNVLRILRGQYPNPCSIQVIMERMIDRSSNASRIVEKLRSKNLASRTESIVDRRLVDVLITPVGMDLLKKLDSVIDSYERSFENQLSVADADKINGLLDTLRNNQEVTTEEFEAS